MNSFQQSLKQAILPEKMQVTVQEVQLDKQSVIYADGFNLCLDLIEANIETCGLDRKVLTQIIQSTSDEYTEENDLPIMGFFQNQKIVQSISNNVKVIKKEVNDDRATKKF